MSRTARISLWSALLVVFVCATLGLTDQLTPVQNCINALAKESNVAPDKVRVMLVEGVVWPDTSLGCPQPGQAYAAVMTPGYKVLLGLKEQRYQYHTDMGQRLVLASTNGVPTPANQITNPPPQQQVSPQQQTPALIAATACRDNLATRLVLKPDEVTVTGIQAVSFPDASLGLPVPGEAAAQVVTPGFIVTLNGNNIGYLYTAAGKTCRFGGPIEARSYSALYLEAIANEPNLNSNLMQISLSGACPTLVVQGVTGYRPQANGSVLAQRRTSRSGFDLLYIPPAGTGAPLKIASAFDFGDGAVNGDAKRWVSYVRSRAGAAWQVAWGNVEPAKANLLDDILVALGGGGTRVDLPAGATPARLYWVQDNPVALVMQDNAVVAHELLLANQKPSWRKLNTFSAAVPEDFQLNKSETLIAKTSVEQGKQVTRVIRKWFTGKETVVAAIGDFKAEEMYLAMARFVLLSGERGGKTIGLTVDLASGVTLDAVKESNGPVRMLLAPPQGWLWSQLPATP